MASLITMRVIFCDYISIKAVNGYFKIIYSPINKHSSRYTHAYSMSIFFTPIFSISFFDSVPFIFCAIIKYFKIVGSFWANSPVCNFMYTIRNMDY